MDKKIEIITNKTEHLLELGMVSEPIKSILHALKESKAFRDKILYTKLARYIYEYAILEEDESVEKKIEDMFLGAGDLHSEEILQVMQNIDELVENEKVKYYAYLNYACINSPSIVTKEVYRKFFSTLKLCTCDELEYVKETLLSPSEIIVKSSNITLFSLEQYGLVQKKQSKDGENLIYYFTDYAKLFWKYVLNYGGSKEEETKQMSLHNIPICEMFSGVQPNIPSVEPIIRISDIKSGLRWKDNLVYMSFSFDDTNVVITPDKFFYTFESNSDYYIVDEGYICNKKIEDNHFSFNCRLEKGGLRTCANYGAEFFFKINKGKIYYARIFRNDRRFVCEFLEEQQYEKTLEFVKKAYRLGNNEIEASNEGRNSKHLKLGLHYRLLNQKFTPK